ncbi:cyclase family protein [Microbacterium sp. BWT-B31]|uniref:cyclase family protein n=1 Tax=Microbacterium sp. BWT-B31 TaxID=3232072 RepID=UPI0035288C64
MIDLDTGEAVAAYLREQSNWGRWGADDELGTLNLVTAEKRLAALALAHTGQSISLSRPLAVRSVGGDAPPATIETVVVPRDDAGSVIDHVTLTCHDTANTHIDSLCHIWDRDGQWNGRDPAASIQRDGVTFGSVEAYSAGIITRGLLLDVPAHRGTDHVTQDRPVTGEELFEIADSMGLDPQPGDAICVYSGRDRWDARHPAWGTGSRDAARSVRPGLHASCLRFLREVDAGMLVWDMMDMRPSGVDIPFSIHGAVWAFGLALLDNADLGHLSEACRTQDRHEFLLCVAPLRIPGGTGSAVNPLAVF